MNKKDRKRLEELIKNLIMNVVFAQKELILFQELQNVKNVLMGNIH